MLNNQVVLVSGGSNGIGAATVRLLAEQGATVVVGYHRSEGPAAALAARLPAEAGAPPHAALKCPVTDSAALARMAE